MSYQTIRLGQEDDIATIILNRPEVMNGLNSAMRREIPAAVAEASARPLLRSGPLRRDGDGHPAPR